MSAIRNHAAPPRVDGAPQKCDALHVETLLAPETAKSSFGRRDGPHPALMDRKTISFKKGECCSMPTPQKPERLLRTYHHSQVCQHLFRHAHFSHAVNQRPPRCMETFINHLPKVTNAKRMPPSLRRSKIFPHTSRHPMRHLKNSPIPVITALPGAPYLPI